MTNKRQDVVPNRTSKQIDRLLIPVLIQRGPQHRVNGNQQCAEGDGRIALPQTAEQNEAAGRKC